LPAGISAGTSINNRWSAGISTVCSIVMVIVYLISVEKARSRSGDFKKTGVTQ
jgi:hypothetical protein